MTTPLPEGHTSTARQFLPGIAALVAAFLLTLWLQPMLQQNRFLLFYVAVIVSAWFGGLKPSLVVAFASAVFVPFLFSHPVQIPTLNIADLPRSGLFLLLSLIPGLMGEGRIRAERKAQQVQDELEKRVQEKTADLKKAIQDLRSEVEAHEKTEAALWASENRLAALFADAPAGLAILDDKLRYVRINESLARINRLPANEHLGKTIAEVLPSFAPVVEQAMRSVLETGQPTLNVELSGAVSGEQRYFLASYFPVPGIGGQPSQIGVIIVDITDRKKGEEALLTAEKALRQAQKMEAIGTLAAGIAHNFNNLLSIIDGYTHIAYERVDADNPVRNDLEEARSAVERAAQLTRQLMAFSRKQVLQPRVLDLNRVVSNLRKMLQPLIGSTIELETSLEPGLGQVMADEGQIEQVIMNLVVNACDAMPDGGRLTLVTANARFDERSGNQRLSPPPGYYAMIAVQDTGVGMDQETQVHIFDPFFTTKGPGKGTGLGLSTAYGIVKQSGGYIFFQSEPGRGTTFSIYLPRIEAAKGKSAGANA